MCLFAAARGYHGTWVSPQAHRYTTLMKEEPRTHQEQRERDAAHPRIAPEAHFGRMSRQLLFDRAQRALYQLFPTTLLSFTAWFALGSLCHSWLRQPPPWWLSRLLGTPEVRLMSWDTLRHRKESAVRGGRQAVRLLLIRHGESEANLRAMQTIAGRDAKSPLSKKGEVQAQRLGARLRQERVRPHRVIVSNALRARRTAEIACAEAGLFTHSVALEVEPRVVEFSQGSFELRPRHEVYQPGGPVSRAIEREQCFFRPPGVSPEGARGESQHDVEVRFREFVEECLLDSPPRTEELQTILVFSHGIAIRSFVRGVLGASCRFVVHSETENTSITELVYKPVPPSRSNLGGWTLVRFNDAAHLIE